MYQAYTQGIEMIKSGLNPLNIESKVKPAIWDKKNATASDRILKNGVIDE